MAIFNAPSSGGTVFAGISNDTVNGSAFSDTLHGLGGNDTINGGDADDKIFGDGAISYAQAFTAFGYATTVYTGRSYHLWQWAFPDIAGFSWHAKHLAHSQHQHR